MARLAVVGGGWAGLAAAVEAVRAGHQVTVLEAARQLGGRARTLDVTLPDGRIVALDNGQHILIGAYRQTLGLMQSLGVEPADVLLPLPLTLRFPDGSGLALPRWPAPLDVAAGILGARGWSGADRLSLLRAAIGWRLRGFRCAPTLTVAQVCEGVRPRVMATLIEPLCVAALNTPADRASGEVFLRVLRDSLFGPGFGAWGASWLLVPRAPLGRLLPDAAAAWLTRQGARIAPGHRVTALAPGAGGGWQVDGEVFDAVVLACPAGEAARLVRSCGIDAAAWAAQAHGLAHESIATVYALGPASGLGLPMLALREGPQAPAQFVFDRGRLGGPPGLLAFVASASQGDRDTLERQVLAQAAALGWRGLQPVGTVVEKRATFACTPGLSRPPVAIAPGLAACGDYVAGPYPATLEGAVRSAQAAVAQLVSATPRTAR